jgi:hypothetical protein
MVLNELLCLNYLLICLDLTILKKYIIQGEAQLQHSTLIYNPCSTAFSGRFIMTIIGAAIHDHSVHDEGATLLTGGATIEPPIPAIHIFQTNSKMRRMSED